MGVIAMTIIAKNIRFLRKKHNLSQDQLAKIVSKGSFTTIQKWESGASEPSLGCVTTMADFFNVDIDNFVKVDLEIEQSNNKGLPRRMRKYVESLSAADIEIIRRIAYLSEDARDSILHQIEYEYEKEKRKSKANSELSEGA